MSGLNGVLNGLMAWSAARDYFAVARSIRSAIDMPGDGIPIDFAGLVLPAHPASIAAPDGSFAKSDEWRVAASTLAGSQDAFPAPAIP